MRRLLLIFILTFSFQTLTKADDISDFQIEGMSIGDTLLDFFDYKELSKVEKYYYPGSKKFVGLYSDIFNQNLSEYDAIQFSVDPNTYIIEAIAGLNYKFKDRKIKCYTEMEKIFDELKLDFPNSKISKAKEGKHDADKSGKSVAKVYKIYLTNGRIQVTCTDWAPQTEKWDSLKISLHTKRHIQWINNEAY